MSRKISFVESAMKNRQIVFLTMVMMIALGVYALCIMPRQEFPTVTIRQGLIIGAYPGADSKQVSEQLTTEVERYLFSYKEVNKKKTFSYSRDGLMIIFVELNDKVKNSDEFWSKLKHGLNNFKASLPAGVMALYADNDFGDTSALLLSVEADHKTYRELETYVNQLEDRLRRIESVSKLRHFGLQQEQISIYLNREKLNEYGINSSLITAGLFSQGLTISAAKTEDGNTELPVHISSLYQTEEDIAGQIIYSDPTGNILRLKDVARIVREYPNPDSYIENNAHKCLLISMEMLEGNNIVKFGKEVDDILNAFGKTLPDGVTIKRVADQPFVVSNSVSTFMLELLFAILSVILVTMLLLPLRVASVAAMSIPVTIFISLGLMNVFGIELNTVTLAALIVVLGMIVDNSIVIVDSYLEKLDHGVSRWFAAISSARTYFKAILSATLAISITFFPFLFTLKGTFKDFVEMFPWTVTLTLGISLIVAMMIIPYLQYFFIRQGFSAEHKLKKHFNILDFIQRKYEKYLNGAFKRPALTIGLGICSVLLAVALFFFIPQRLLPVAERNQFAVEIYLPQGSALKSTEMVADSLEKMMSADKKITSITSFIGTSSPRFHTTYAPKIPAKNYAQFIVNTVSSEATIELLDEYTSRYSNYFPNAYVRFKQIDYQPISAPVEVRITGNSLAAIQAFGDSLIPSMRQLKGIAWVRTDYGELQPAASIQINSTEANRLGINKSTIAANLALAYTGIPVATIWEDDYPVAVKLMADLQDGSGKIKDQYIHSMIPGVTVPLRQIAEVRPAWTNGQIVRRNGIPTLTIMADINRNEKVNDVFCEVKEMVEKSSIPAGISINYGGSYELDEENVPNIITGLMVAIFIIFMILLIHFRKISMALLILGSSSLSLLGAFLGVLLLGNEFGITSILGIVSLIGILVRNGIIMLDYAEELREKHHVGVKEAAFEAGKRRMRPIFLTSAAASVGVVPMIISANPLWSPMGAVICFGTLTSMVMLVLILPVAYWLIFKNEDKIRGQKVTSNKVLPVTIFLMLAGGVSNRVSAQQQNNDQALTLEYCKQLALANNTQIKNADLEVLSSQQVKKSTFTNYFPKISATGMVYRFDKPLVKLEIPGGNLPVYDGNPVHLQTPVEFAYFPGISLSMIDKGTLGAVTAIQPVFTGGRIINGNQLAKLGIQVNQLKKSLTTHEIMVKTEEQYWRIVSLSEKRQILKVYEELLDSLFNEANDAYNAGLINKNDVLKVSIKQAEIKTNMLKLYNGIRLANMAFCQYLGIPYNVEMQLTDSIMTGQDPASLYTDPEEAVLNREEFSLLESGVKAEKYKTRMKVGEYMPQAGIGAGALYYDITGDGKSNTMVFGSLNIPISDWWSASHEIKERRYQEEIAHNNADNSKELLVLQVRKIWDELNESWQQIEVAVESKAQADENLKINSDNFRAGMLNISDMLEAQVLALQAGNQLTEARMLYHTKVAEYLIVTGR